MQPPPPSGGGFFIGYDQTAAGLQLGGYGGEAATAPLLCLR